MRNDADSADDDTRARGLEALVELNALGDLREKTRWMRGGGDRAPSGSSPPSPQRAESSGDGAGGKLPAKERGANELLGAVRAGRLSDVTRLAEYAGVPVE